MRFGEGAATRAREPVVGLQDLRAGQHPGR